MTQTALMLLTYPGTYLPLLPLPTYAPAFHDETQRSSAQQEVRSQQGRPANPLWTGNAGASR